LKKKNTSPTRSLSSLPIPRVFLSRRPPARPPHHTPGASLCLAQARRTRPTAANAAFKWRPPATARCRPNCNTFWRRSRRKRRYEGRKRRVQKRPLSPGRGRETGGGIKPVQPPLSTPFPLSPPSKRTSDPANRGPRHRPVLGQVHGHARPVAGVARVGLLQRLRATVFGHDPVYCATVPGQVAGSGRRGAGVMRIVWERKGAASRFLRFFLVVPV
jgi:hypothetical protein